MRDFYREYKRNRETVFLNVENLLKNQSMCDTLNSH